MTKLVCARKIVVWRNRREETSFQLISGVNTTYILGKILWSWSSKGSKVKWRKFDKSGKTHLSGI